MLDYKLDQAGFLAAFPYLLMACIVQSAGVLADMARTKGRLSTTQVILTLEDNFLCAILHVLAFLQVRKLFTCGSYLCQTIFMSLTALLMFRGAAITCISLSLGCGGFAWAGFSINHLDIAPQLVSDLAALWPMLSCMFVSQVRRHPDGHLQHHRDHPGHHQPGHHGIHRQG